MPVKPEPTFWGWWLPHRSIWCRPLRYDLDFLQNKLNTPQRYLFFSSLLKAELIAILLHECPQVNRYIGNTIFYLNEINPIYFKYRCSCWVSILFSVTYICWLFFIAKLMKSSVQLFIFFLSGYDLIVLEEKHYLELFVVCFPTVIETLPCLLDGFNLYVTFYLQMFHSLRCHEMKLTLRSAFLRGAGRWDIYEKFFSFKTAFDPTICCFYNYYFGHFTYCWLQTRLLGPW